MAGMLNDELLAAGNNEVFKGAVHLALFSLASAFTLYNAGALFSRPTRQLAFNTVIYAGLMALEARQVRQHWSTRCES